MIKASEMTVGEKIKHVLEPLDEAARNMRNLASRLMQIAVYVKGMQQNAEEGAESLEKTARNLSHVIRAEHGDNGVSL